MWAERTEECLSVSDRPLFWDANDRYLQPGHPLGWRLCRTGAWSGCGSSSTGQRGLVRDGTWSIAARCQLELLWGVVSLEQREKFQEKNKSFFWFKLEV